jgi:hypothetical protein
MGKNELFPAGKPLTLARAEYNKPSRGIKPPPDKWRQRPTRPTTERTCLDYPPAPPFRKDHRQIRPDCP